MDRAAAGERTLDEYLLPLANVTGLTTGHVAADAQPIVPLPLVDALPLEVELPCRGNHTVAGGWHP